ncbi:polysaccharide pyruvyl transferase family protein [Bavariicoccus seileri]|uniref:polysaccharide pyruvyl transferase family protein n=1 Tax=Bavariicoccus seileri TaxID=549685 RepID=UPI0003B6CF48|nr:polysaccharide pyruvyl transferase family protein [Bavariicoccus seileri]
MAPKLIEEGLANNKKYKVAIIPHFKEQNHSFFAQLAKELDGSKLIDLRDEPHHVVEQIAQSELVISSSLHGLIVADSFRVPNLHLVVTNKLLGDGFKFDDYYSAYGLSHEYISFDEINDISKIPEMINNSYRITDEMVSEMQKNMIEAFPFNKDEGE